MFTHLFHRHHDKSASHHPTPVEILFNHVNHANHVEIEKTWRHRPELMLTEVKDENGNMTTPLKRALYNLDSYAWKPFYENIKHSPDMMKDFFQQFVAQSEYIDLQPLFDAYGIYDLNKTWELNHYDNQHRKMQTDQLGDIQKKYLPMCMLKEMCREGFSWYLEEEFKVKKLPHPAVTHLYTGEDHHYINLEDIQSNQDFGPCAFVRGANKPSAHLVPMKKNNVDVDENLIIEDGKIFVHLYRARIADLNDVHVPRKYLGKIPEMR